MWPFRAERNESCKKRLDVLEETVRNLQVQLTDVNLEVLDKAEKVAAKLKDRERKREERLEPERQRRPWELG